MRSGLSSAFERHLSDLDARDQMALADASDAWAREASSVTKDTYQTKRSSLVDLVSVKATQSVRWFIDAARQHVADELLVVADEARRVANGAPRLMPDEAALRTLAENLLLRLDPLVAAAEDVPGTLIAEAHQVERIVQTESFGAYNAQRDASIQTLLSRGNTDSYAVNIDASQVRDAGDWIPGIVKRWSALLDRRTCPRCSALHGDLQPLGMPFSDDLPPLHARCRCVVGYWPIAVPKPK